jgi:hypothetical protein
MAQDTKLVGVKKTIAAQWVLLGCLLLPSLAFPGAESELRFEIATLPGFERYAALLEHPGYIGVLLENADLRPSLSTKLIVRDGGREVQAKGLIIRFSGKSAASYTYEAGVSLGIGKTSVTFPVVVDLSGLAAGKTIVVAKLPLATLLSDEKRKRIQTKVGMLANADAQQKILDYLDALAKGTDSDAEQATLREAILVDAYNRSAGLAMAGPDVGEAVPLSEQWMLILTLAIWLILFPAGLLIYRLRRRRTR